MPKVSNHRRAEKKGEQQDVVLQLSRSSMDSVISPPTILSSVASTLPSSSTLCTS